MQAKLASRSIVQAIAVLRDQSRCDCPASLPGFKKLDFNHDPAFGDQQEYQFGLLAAEQEVI